MPSFGKAAISANPGAFDYAGYLARKEIYWTASPTRAGAPVQIYPVLRITLGRLSFSAAGGRARLKNWEALRRPALRDRHDGSSAHRRDVQARKSLD